MQEIKELGEQLKLKVTSQTSGMLREYKVEFLQAEIKQKMDEYNKFLLEKEQNHQEFTACDKEIEKLVAHTRTENRGTEVLRS